MAKRVVKKAATASASVKKIAPRVVKDAEIDKGATQDAIDSGDASKGGKPKIHAKVVHVLVSIGTEDRNRSHEKMVEDVRKKLGLVPYGQKGLHGSVTGGYYILDGQVCLPDDYDPKTGTFKEGAVPPTWAGGPKPSRMTGSREQMENDKINLSSDAYDRKYSIGKYAPKVPKSQRAESHAAHTQRMRAERDAKKAESLRAEEEEIEEILDDEEALNEAASASVKRAVKKLKSTPKKRVVKKAAAKKTTGRKVVRRK